MQLAGDCRATIPLSVQQISDLNLFPVTFYKPLNVQDRMCELCTFSQIQSHMKLVLYICAQRYHACVFYLVPVHVKNFCKLYACTSLLILSVLKPSF